jgi:CheY-like chemotaxis protein
MNAVLGFAQILSLRLAPRLNDDERQQLSNIQTAGWHLLGLIDDLLDLSRLEAGTLRIARAIVPMRQCAQQALNLLSERAVSASITLHLDMPEGEVAAWADPARLRQVFINLVSNSIKYNRPGGVCEVRIAHERGGRVACEVADSGLGMSPDQMSHLFEPFNRLGRESLSAEGHGIGLLIVRELVEAMGGKLVVTSQPGVGTSIRFTLQAADAADAAASGFTPLATDACDVDEIVDVVLLEDNEVNVVLIESVIKLRPRCRLHVATSGREAVQLLRRIRPRLALLDINVPDLNGLEVLRLAIADPTTVDTAYVMLSADAGDQSVSQSLAAGAAAYLFKPVNIEELLEVIDRLALRTVRTAICPEA